MRATGNTLYSDVVRNERSRWDVIFYVVTCVDLRLMFFLFKTFSTSFLSTRPSFVSCFAMTFLCDRTGLNISETGNVWFTMQKNPLLPVALWVVQHCRKNIRC